MNIFEKRPLCLILCIGLSGFLLFTLDNPTFKIGLIVISILLGIISLIFRIDKSKKMLIGISAIAILLASILSFLYFDLYFKAYERYDVRIEVVGMVEGISQPSSYSTRLTVKVESINGKRSSYRFYAYTTKTDAKEVVEGSRISFNARLDGFSKESYTYNIANGINAYASDVEDLKIIEYTNGNLRLRFERAREYLTRYIIKLSSKDTGAILSALLLGQRDYLPDQLRLDFKRIGISHILALSGMHLAILSLGVDKALLMLRVKKKTRIIAISSFVFLYMALTGFSVSVVRSGIMLILSSILFLLSRTKDSLTSLSVAVLLICLFTPYAIMDISLWLSALATFGIIAFAEITVKLEKPLSKREKIIRYLGLSITASIFAISFTIAVSSFTFGGFSILAPITTLIFSILAELIMYLGCIMMLIGWVIPIGWIVAPLCRFMSILAGAFSSIKFAYVSSNFITANILIILYTAIFLFFVILKFKNPVKIMNYMVVCFLVVTLFPSVLTIAKNNKETVAYYSDSKCDELLIRSKNEVCLINSSQYSKNLAYTSLDLLDDANVTYLDKYLLTHYSWAIDDEIELLLYNVSVGKIYLPTPRNSDEETILKIVYKTVENHRTEVILYQEMENVTVGQYTINLLHSEPYGTTSMNAFVVAKDDELITYVSSGLLNENLNDIYRKYISISDHVILGEHGKKYKKPTYIFDCLEDLDNIILHSENAFLRQNNMQYFIDKGCNIYSHPKEIIYLSGK